MPSLEDLNLTIPDALDIQEQQRVLIENFSLIKNAFSPVVSNTTDLADITNEINTVYKYKGKEVYNETTKKPVWADGAADSDIWVDATGATAHTPV